MVLLTAGGCGRRERPPGCLAALDSLVRAEAYDSALVCLNGLPPEMVSERDLGEYYLLAGIVVSKVCPECDADSLLDISLARIGPTARKLLRARVCYWKGSVACDRRQADSAYMWLKQAEALTEAGDSDPDRLRLRHDVELLISYLNNVSGNYTLATDYARRALAISSTLGDASRRGNDYLQLSGSFYHLGLPDSSNVYMDRLERIADLQKERDLPDMLNNIAVSHFQRGDTAGAKALLLRSLGIMPQAHTYYSLAQIYSREGRRDEGARMWDKALEAPDEYLRERITRMYAAWLQENGDYRRSAEMAQSADSLKALLEGSGNDGEKILILENDYQRRSLEGRSKGLVAIVAAGCVAVVALLCVGWRVHMVRTRRRHFRKQAGMAEILRSQAAAGRQEKAELERQAASAMSEKERLHRELLSARSEMDRERRHRRMVTDKGPQLYRQLLVDGKASQWNKADASLFWEYFSMVDPDLASQVDEEYEGLSPNSKVIVALMKIGRSNEEICRVLGMSDGALRTARSRIKARRR